MSLPLPDAACWKATLAPSLSAISRSYLVASTDVSQYAFELIDTVVADDEPALAGCRVLEGDLGAQFVGDLSLQALNIGVYSRRTPGLGGARAYDAAHQTFGIANRQRLFNHQSGHFYLLASRGEP